MKLNPFAKKAAPAGRRRPESELSSAQTPFAYRSQRSEDAPQVPKRSAKPWYRRLGRRLFYLAVLLLVLNFLILSPGVQLVILNNGGQTLLRDNSIYHNTADNLLGDSIWNRSKLTINTEKLKQQMENQFPELAGVSITLPLLGHQPVVYLEPAKPVLVLTSGNGALVIDADGKAILRTDADSPALNQMNLPRLEDQSGFNIPPNRQVLPAAQVGFIQHVSGQLNAKGYTVSGMTLPPASSELDVKLAGQPYIVKFNLQNNDPRGQAGTFLATIANLKKQNITPTKYVDARVPGRAYYQ